MTTPPENLQEAPNPGLELEGIYLHDASFRRTGPASPDDAEAVPIRFEMALRRETRFELGVQIGVIVEVPGMFDAKITYRIELSKSEDDGAPDDSFWMDVASKLAPVIVFPFIRETLSSLITKAGFPPSLLPIINVGQIWSHEEISLPDLPDKD